MGIAIVVAGGCLPPLDAKPVPLVYDVPKARPPGSGIVIAVRSVRDLRESRDLDGKVMDVPAAVSNAIRREIAARPGVGRVTVDDPESSGADFVVTASLLVLGSTIPYRAGALAGMVAEGLVADTGGLIVGRTETQSKGLAVLRIEVARLDGGLLAEKTLVGEAGRDIPRSYMDKPQTASRVAGMALKRALEDLPEMIDAAVREFAPK